MSLISIKIYSALFILKELVSQKYLQLRLIVSHEQFSMFTINLSPKFFGEKDWLFGSLNRLSYHIYMNQYVRKWLKNTKKQKCTYFYHIMYKCYNLHNKICIEWWRTRQTTADLFELLHLRHGPVIPVIIWSNKMSIH